MNERFNESHPSDTEKLHSTIIEQEENRQRVCIINRDAQLDQLELRKVSREALELSCLKMNKIPDELKNKVNDVVKEFKVRKNYKDPSKQSNLCSVIWHNSNRIAYGHIKIYQKVNYLI